jgi:hypothetical protein
MAKRLYVNPGGGDESLSWSKREVNVSKGYVFWCSKCQDRHAGECQSKAGPVAVGSVWHAQRKRSADDDYGPGMPEISYTVEAVNGNTISVHRAWDKTLAGPCGEWDVSFFTEKGAEDKRYPGEYLRFIPHPRFTKP